MAVTDYVSINDYVPVTIYVAVTDYFSVIGYVPVTIYVAVTDCLSVIGYVPVTIYVAVTGYVTVNGTGLDLRMTTYLCVATGSERGFIELVLETDTTANITTKYAGGAGGAFSKEPMALFLHEHNPSEAEYKAAVEARHFSHPPLRRYHTKSRI